MAICYKKLWKLLIDKDLKKKYLLEKAGISRTTLTRLNHDEHVSTESLMKICVALECSVDDIIEFVED